MIIKLILLILFFYIACFLIGSLYTAALRPGQNAASVSVVMGLAAVTALLEVLSALFGSFRGSLRDMTGVWLITVLSASAAALAAGLKRGSLGPVLKGMFVKSGRNLKEAGAWVWVFAAAVLLIFLQTAGCVFLRNDFNGAADAVASAVEVWERDSLVNSFGQNPLHGFWLLPAALSKITGLHPLVIAKTALPAVMIPCSYMAYMAAANQLFRGKKRLSFLFLLFVCVLQLYGLQSTAMEEAYLLAAPYGGNAFFVNILIPLVFYQAFLLCERRLVSFGAPAGAEGDGGENTGAGTGWWAAAGLLAVWLAGVSASPAGMAGITLLILSLAAVRAAMAYREAREASGEAGSGQGGSQRSNDRGTESEDGMERQDGSGKKQGKMGKMITVSRNKAYLVAGIAVLFMAGTVFSIFKLNVKINTLYHAARDLEHTYSSQAHLFELRQDGDGEVKGYALVLTNGELVLLDGGNADNESYMHEFIVSHGGVVDTWYMTEKNKDSVYEALKKADYPDISLGRAVYLQKGRQT